MRGCVGVWPVWVSLWIGPQADVIGHPFIRQRDLKEGLGSAAMAACAYDGGTSATFARTHTQEEVQAQMDATGCGESDVDDISPTYADSHYHTLGIRQ
jgi:hypothetical protein